LELKKSEEHHANTLKAVEERHSVALQRAREMHAAAEKLRRERWIDNKKQKIKVTLNIFVFSVIKNLHI
jgi:5-azacytidine-induced protein 1